MKTLKHSHVSEPNTQDLQLIITVVSLFVFFPVGLVFMWMWMKWPLWARIAITVLFLIPFIFIAVFIYVFLTSVIYKPASNNIGIIPTGNTPALYSTAP